MRRQAALMTAAALAVLAVLGLLGRREEGLSDTPEAIPAVRGPRSDSKPARGPLAGRPVDQEGPVEVAGGAPARRGPGGDDLWTAGAAEVEARSPGRGPAREDVATPPPGHHVDRPVERPSVVHEGAIVLELPDLVERSDRIVVGRVVSSASRWNEDRSIIYTVHRLEVDRAIKGTSGEATVEVRVVGGEIREENVALEVSHQPRLAPGDEGIFFLADDPTLASGVVGGEQGFLRFDRADPDRAVARDGFGRPMRATSGERLDAGELVETVRRIAD